ncbi:hypothetical protein L596_010801 [Steinernema carpocapsae]|uniref:Uncharacterized protein n=1 Tax=Steinernema carpocapsae TaxID=34508 RepID=A0A4U5PJP6_STECR|nr:hypothetical protein L596_010801 [Steinernema carpocapsae]
MPNPGVADDHHCVVIRQEPLRDYQEQLHDRSGTVENVTVGVTNRVYPLYSHYYAPAEAQVTNFYNQSVNGTNDVVNKAKNAAVVTGTLSLGAFVVATQMSLALGLAGTNVLLDSVIATKRAGGQVVHSVVATEQALQRRILAALENAQRIAMIPLDKASEHANSLIDVANGIVDRFLGPPEEVDPQGASIKDRVVRLSKRIIGLISQRAQHDFVDPLQRQIFTTLDSLNKNVDLLEYVRAKQTWAVEKAEEISNSLAETRQWVQNEAKKFNVSPEEILLNQIKQSSSKLSVKLSEFKNKGTEIVGEDVASKIDSTVAFFQGLDANFAEANNIYQVRDDLINETKQRLHDIQEWTNAWMVRINHAESQNASDADSERED